MQTPFLPKAQLKCGRLPHHTLDVLGQCSELWDVSSPEAKGTSQILYFLLCSRVCIMTGGDVIVMGAKGGSKGAKNVYNTMVCGPPKATVTSTNIQYTCTVNIPLWGSC